MSNGNGQNNPVLFRYYGNVLSMSQSGPGSDGWLSSIDWNRFNSTALGFAPVTSVFGRIGAVVAQPGDYAAFYQPLGNYEPVLGNPSQDGYLLSSTTSGVRSWVAPAVATAEEDQWSYSTNNTVTDPGNKKFRTNTSLFSLASVMAISVISNSSVDRTGALSGVQQGDTIFVQDAGNASNWMRYRVTAPPINHTTWFEIDIAMMTGGGAAVGNNSNVLFSFSHADPVPVTSVFGRTGAVVAQNGDYTLNQIGPPTANWALTGGLRIKTDGSLQLWNPDQSKWHTLQVHGTAGAEYITIGAGET